MKTKRILITVTIVVFFLVAVAVGLACFTLKSVETTFASAGVVDEASVLAVADKYKGENLLFLDCEKIREDIEKNPYYKVDSLTKVFFPNKVAISVTERREVYLLKNGEKNYVISEDGMVLKTVNDAEYTQAFSSRLYIRLYFDGIDVVSAEVGKLLATSSDKSFSEAIKLALSVGLTDCIDSMTVTLRPYGEVPGAKCTDVAFNTYTGVRLDVWNIESKGQEKTDRAFGAYDAQSSDYIKSFYRIIVHDTVDGGIEVEWSAS